MEQPVALDAVSSLLAHSRSPPRQPTLLLVQVAGPPGPASSWGKPLFLCPQQDVVWPLYLKLGRRAPSKPLRGLPESQTYSSLPPCSNGLAPNDAQVRYLCRRHTSFLCLRPVSMKSPVTRCCQSFKFAETPRPHSVRGIPSLTRKTGTYRAQRQREKVQILQEGEQGVKPFPHPPFCSQTTVTNTVACDSHWFKVHTMS